MRLGVAGDRHRKKGVAYVGQDDHVVGAIFHDPDLRAFEDDVGDVHVETELAHREAHLESTGVAAETDEFVEREDVVPSAVEDLFVDCLDVEVGVFEETALSAGRAAEFDGTTPEAKSVQNSSVH